MMNYMKALLENQTYLTQLSVIEEMERERIYCKHGFAHLMDVARLACLRNEEESCGLSKEQIYLAALLHDIGRAEEYKYGISHAKAGKKMAGEILLHIQYPEEQIQGIVSAIEGHCGEKDVTGGRLEGLIRWADKASRACFLCKAKDSCKWEESKRNGTAHWQ